MSLPLRRDHAPPPSGAPVRRFLTEAIASDLTWTGLQVGTIAMLMNASVARRENWTLRSRRHILQGNANTMVLALRYGGEIGIPAKLTDCISTLYRDVARAQADVAEHMIGMAAYSEPDRRRVAEASPRWRELARESGRAIGAFADATRGSLSSQSLNDFATLARFLTDAANGGSTRVGPTGDMELPSLEQRRRTPRLPLRVACKLMLADRAVPAQLVDISREGFGIQCAHTLTIRQSLTIALDDGRRMRAVVVRASPDHAGLRLETPLSTNDPLFVRARSN